MKAGVIFSGSGPILILTTGEDLVGEKVSAWLGNKGLKKYIAYEVDVELCRKRYGQHFDVTLKDVKEQEDLRCLDYNGQRVFELFSFEEMGRPMYHG
ncbi:MAG: hypothetical protein V1816_15190 [Pseudomonadota bacterium]